MYRVILVGCLVLSPAVAAQPVLPLITSVDPSPGTQPVVPATAVANFFLAGNAGLLAFGDSFTNGSGGFVEIRSTVSGAPSTLLASIGPGLPGWEIGYSLATGPLNGGATSALVVGAPGVGNGAGLVAMYSVTSTGAATLSWAAGGAGRFGHAVAFTTNWNGANAVGVIVGEPLNATGGAVSMYNATGQQIWRTVLSGSAGFSVAASLTDLNGNGSLDVIVGDPLGDQVIVLEGSNGAIIRAVASPTPGTRFGHAVAETSGNIYVGEPFGPTGSPATSTGQVQVINGATGAVTATITPGAAVPTNAWFGYALAVIGIPDQIAIGAPFGGPNGAGLVELWNVTPLARAAIVNGSATGDALGASLASAALLVGGQTTNVLVGVPGGNPNVPIGGLQIH